ncbi:MAG TPA: GNAT family N-acetyltransferase [Cyclobacteriaceae bacterium]|jgi:GNAT superfamily N-acetyltransferase|nr:GNAT family N-acetyltransferase [Cyclobacteriaceae bacterium]
MLQLNRTTASDPDFQYLVHALDQELSMLYGDEQEFFQGHNHIDLSAKVIVAYHQNQPVACGCFRPAAENCIEIKRMFTKPEMRNQGFAKKILNALEAWALEENVERIILETGVKQPEAVAAYTKSGYKVIENYGPYVNNASSICMEKFL